MRAVSRKTRGLRSGTDFSTEANFNQWYRDVAGVNQSKAFSLDLTETSPGSGILSYTNNSFFPIDGELFGNQGRSHNYHFTLQLAGQFSFQDNQSFTFTGDDDLWVFIDNRLAIDLGGVHGRETASVHLDGLGLRVGFGRKGLQRDRQAPQTPVPPLSTP